MRRLLAAILVVIGSVGAARDHTPFDELTTDMPGLGRVTFSARLLPQHARVVVRAAKGNVLMSRKLPIPKVESRAVVLRELRLNAVRSPMILLLVYGPAADGGWIDASLYAARDGKVDDIVDLSAITRLDDGLCVGSFGVIVGQHLQEGEAAIGPHRYRATSFRWNGRAFTRRETRETARVYSSFTEAQAELGLRCTNRLHPL